MAGRHITRVRLRNFQKHEDRTFEFGPGLNAIVGASDRGKSAILRAITWIAMHKPTSSDYVRFGQKTLSARIEFSDETFVERFREDESGYRTPTGEWKSVRVQPPEVLNLLRLTPANFQKQRDPYFMLSLSPGDLARELNKIIDLEVIDQVASWVKSTLSDCDSSARSLEQWIKGKEERLAKLHWVDAAVEDMATMNTMQERRRELAMDLPRLAAMIADIRDSQKAIRQYGEAVDALTEYVRDTEELLIQRNLIHASISGIRQAVDAYRENHKVLPLLTKRVEILEAYASDVKSIESLIKDRDSMRLEIKQLRDAVDQIGKSFKKISSLDLFLSDIAVIITHVTETERRRAELETLNTLVNDAVAQRRTIAETEGKIEKLKEALGNVCPTCGQFLPKPGE